MIRKRVVFLGTEINCAENAICRFNILRVLFTNRLLEGFFSSACRYLFCRFVSLTSFMLSLFSSVAYAETSCRQSAMWHCRCSIQETEEATLTQYRTSLHLYTSGTRGSLCWHKAMDMCSWSISTTDLVSSIMARQRVAHCVPMKNGCVSGTGGTSSHSTFIFSTSLSSAAYTSECFWDRCLHFIGLCYRCLSKETRDWFAAALSMWSFVFPCRGWRWWFRRFYRFYSNWRGFKVAGHETKGHA